MRQWVKKEIYNEKLFFVSVAKAFTNLTTGQVVTMKTTDPVLVLSSEKGKLAGQSGQWTLASSGSLVHLCNEPLHKGFICCFSTWMWVCQINEFPLPFRGNAPHMLKTQCSSQDFPFPSNCLLSLYLLCQRNQENMKSCPSKCCCISLSEKFQCDFSFCLYMFNKPKSTESKCSFRCCSNFSTIH